MLSIAVTVEFLQCLHQLLYFAAHGVEKPQRRELKERETENIKITREPLVPRSLLPKKRYLRAVLKIISNIL